MLNINKLSAATNSLTLATQDDVRLVKETASDIKELSLSTKNITLATRVDLSLVNSKALDVEREVQETKAAISRQAIFRWLSAPDPSPNHHRACSSKTTNTGSWFIQSEMLIRWKRTPNSILWLHGKAGCSKTVLTSTAITEASLDVQSRTTAALAYFYFDFTDTLKQKSDNMVRSLLVQLSAKPLRKVRELEALFSESNEGSQQPPTGKLLITLKEVMEVFDDIYIFIDALDECMGCRELLNIMTEVHSWGLTSLHILLTSRRIPEIENRLVPLTCPEDRINIQSALVDADIHLYISERLKSDQDLRRWRNHPAVQEEIKVMLMKKADGM